MIGVLVHMATKILDRDAVIAEYEDTDHITWRGRRIPRVREEDFEVVFQGRAGGAEIRVILGVSEWISWFDSGLGSGSGRTPKEAISRAFTNMRARAGKSLQIANRLTWGWQG